MTVNKPKATKALMKNDDFKLFSPKMMQQKNDFSLEMAYELLCWWSKEKDSVFAGTRGLPIKKEMQTKNKHISTI